MSCAPEPGSYEARHPTPVQKSAATRAANATRRRAQSERVDREARERSEFLKSPHYRCPELDRNPGLTDARFTAYRLPSRVGNRLHFPDGHSEVGTPAMRTAQHLKSMAIQAAMAQPKDLPKFWRASTTPHQKLDARLIHWDLIGRVTSGTADRADLWDWMETGFTYSQLIHLLAEDGTEFTSEAMTAIAGQLNTYEAVALHHQRTGRMGFNAAELLTAASVFDSLIELDRTGLAEKVAIWRTALMMKARRKMQAETCE